MITSKNLKRGSFCFCISGCNDNLDANFNKQLITTLNQIGFNDDERFTIWNDWKQPTYDYWFSNKILKQSERAWKITNGRLAIISSKSDDLLNVSYYLKLICLRAKCLIENYLWTYYPQDLVLQTYNYFNIKLARPINQYDDHEIAIIGTFVNDLYQLLIKNNQWDWKQFKDDSIVIQKIDQILTLAITFNLNDFKRPRLQMRLNQAHNFECYLDEVLKPTIDDLWNGLEQLRDKNN